MSSLIPTYPRADQPFQTQRTNHPHHFSTNLANHRKQKKSSRRRRVSSPANHPASHHASRRGLAHRPPREQERARPPAIQTGHQASKQPRRLSSPTGHPDGHHAVRRELAGRPPRRPLGAIGYRCDVVNYSTKNSGGHKVTAWGAAAMAYGDLCSSPEFLSSLYRSSLLPSKHDSHVGETSTSALYFLEPDPLTFLQIQVI
jgi:hypothetical protein